MKSAMIVRPVDSNGRIVIPKNLLNDVFKVKDNEKISIEFFYDDDSIILKRFRPTCVFCNSDKGLKDFSGTKICSECLKKIKNI